MLSSQCRFDLKEIITRKEYNDRGELYRVSQPYYSLVSPSMWDVYTYDTYGRPSKIAYASGAVKSISYSGNTITETTKGVAITHTYDASGKLVSISDPAGATTYNLLANGNPSSVVAPGGIVTNFVYDEYGRRTELRDPSTGTRKSGYDTAGNLIREIDARGKVITMTYDDHGRLLTKVNAENITTSYDYDDFGNVLSEISTNGVSRLFTYDTTNRLQKMKETIVDGNWLEREYAYSGGLVASVKYTSQSGVIGTEVYGYANGYHVSTRWGAGGTYIWKLDAETIRGQPSKGTTGTVSRTYGYDSHGIPTSRSASTSGGSTLMNFSYNFDRTKGNLTSRTDHIRNLAEGFAYDDLNRLTQYGGNTVTYDEKGNITAKSDAGRFGYTDSGKPYALTEAIPTSNSVPLRSQDITYTSYMRPSTIVENGFTAAFTYDVTGDRVKTYITRNGSQYLTRYYIGGVYEKDVNASVTKEKLYLGGDYYSAPVVAVREGTGTWKLYNILRDYLGSVLKITDMNGVAVAEYSYDAWGRMRNPATLAAYAVGNEPELLLGRGFTGHEHLSMFDLINMNARLYDPVLGRFLSPDPYIRNPGFSQDFNRYSYCLNNPLVYVDQDGEFWHIVIGAIIGGVANTVIKAFQGKIHSFGDAAAAFGIGAAAGAIGAAAGGIAFTAAGGEFCGCRFGRICCRCIAGSAFSMPVQSLGNSLYFGDPFLTLKEYISGMAFSGLTGGAINGTIAAFNDLNFWSGNAIAPGRNAFSFNNTAISQRATDFSGGRSEMFPDPLPPVASPDSPNAASSQLFNPEDKIKEMAEMLKPGLRNLGPGQEVLSVLDDGNYVLSVRIETHAAKLGVPEFKQLNIPPTTRVRHMNVQLWRHVNDRESVEIFNKHVVLDIIK